MFHTIAKASSVISDLCWQFFANPKTFELERLMPGKGIFYLDFLRPWSITRMWG